MNDQFMVHAGAMEISPLHGSTGRLLHSHHSGIVLLPERPVD